jgi:uncharacterized protein YndB with AHSA1/START domain
MSTAAIQTNSELDLVLERVVDVPRELVWAAWTRPEHIKKWFTPAPWTTVDCEIDLRPGGIFRTVMRSPEGQEHSGAGCYLEIVPNEKLVWTSALGPGYPAGVQSRRNRVVRRALFHRNNHARSAGNSDEIHGDSDPPPCVI